MNDRKRFRAAAGTPTAPTAPAAPAVKPSVQPETGTDSHSQTRRAPLYRVLVHNDDVTPMEFVVKVLRQVFKKSLAEAIRVMLKAHFSGLALVAVLPLEEAELRVDQAHSIARAAKYPLAFTFEAAE